ncbi:MAG: Gfo/Idh/MocA family oxidoreductase, partial [Chloroflexi bacterium]|nr:Gfo/Idh/MocA family oxidoreductase [Chloroflexota bacterium]
MQPIEPLRIGLVGVGVGASQLLPALTSSPHIALIAAADVRPDALTHFAREFGVETYPSVEQLADKNPRVEAVWVATPNHLHAQHVIAAAERGKHIIVSKPMAITLNEATAMNVAAEQHGVKLLAGHTQSMAPTIRKMAELVHHGELGELGMLHTWHYTDWMYRPRLPAELDLSQGGGPVFRQASHQVDIVRYIAGGLVKSVRANVVQLDSERGAAGAYTAFLEFEDGTPGTIVYSGYGHFAMSELLNDSRPGPSLGRHGSPSPDAEAALKEALRYTGPPGAPGQDTALSGDHWPTPSGRTANSLGLFGLTLVTCARGDLRESADGLFLYQ